MSKSSDYAREVMAHLTYLETEDDTILRDLQAKGFEADMRRAAVDGIIAQMWTREQMDFCKAMDIAGITASQAAKVIKAFSMLQERRVS